MTYSANERTRKTILDHSRKQLAANDWRRILYSPRHWKIGVLKKDWKAVGQNMTLPEGTVVVWKYEECLTRVTILHDSIIGMTSVGSLRLASRYLDL